MPEDPAGENPSTEHTVQLKSDHTSTITAKPERSEVSYKETPKS